MNEFNTGIIVIYYVSIMVKSVHNKLNNVLYINYNI